MPRRATAVPGRAVGRPEPAVAVPDPAAVRPDPGAAAPARGGARAAEGPAGGRGCRRRPGPPPGRARAGAAGCRAPREASRGGRWHGVVPAARAAGHPVTRRPLSSRRARGPGVPSSRGSPDHPSGRRPLPVPGEGAVAAGIPLHAASGGTPSRTGKGLGRGPRPVATERYRPRSSLGERPRTSRSAPHPLVFGQMAAMPQVTVRRREGLPACASDGQNCRPSGGGAPCARVGRPPARSCRQSWTPGEAGGAGGCQGCRMVSDEALRWTGRCPLRPDLVTLGRDLHTGHALRIVTRAGTPARFRPTGPALPGGTGEREVDVRRAPAGW